MSHTHIHVHTHTATSDMSVIIIGTTTSSAAVILFFVVGSVLLVYCIIRKRSRLSLMHIDFPLKEVESKHLYNGPFLLLLYT